MADNKIWEAWEVASYTAREEFIRRLLTQYGKNLKRFCEICEACKDGPETPV